MRRIFLVFFTVVPSLSWSQNTFPTSGNVGIGTSSPSNSLQLLNSGYLGASSHIPLINLSANVDQSNVGGKHGIRFSAKDGSGGFNQKFTEIMNVSEDQWSNRNGLAFHTGGFERLRVNHYGSVGIGTSSPGNRLEIFGSSFNRVSAIVNADVQNGFQIKRVGTNATDWEIYNPSGSTELRLYNSNYGDVLNLRSDGGVISKNSLGIGPVPSFAARLNIADGNGGEQIRISRGTGMVRFAQDINKDNLYLFNGNGSQIYMFWKENGNVGIGSSNPDSKLSVNGTIHTKEVKVDLTGWPDYVFDEDYQLKPLSELKDYINANKHLPGVSTAKEVELHGVMLGEMSKMLL